MRILALIVGLISVKAFGQGNDNVIGRPYKSFDISAFCSYKSFHPSQYLTDNNWDILCAFSEPGTTEKLDSLGIPFNKSQLRLLEVGGLVSSDKGVYTTVMPIFDKRKTEAIRHESKEFADSIFPVIEPEIRKLISEFCNAGYAKQTYSLVFSYLLDDYIWDDRRLPSPRSCEDHGTWTGAYWAMYEPRANVKIGTNGYGPVKQNWTDELGYWLSSRKIISFANEVSKTKGRQIDNKEVINAVKGWGLTDEAGNILIPVMRANGKDNMDLLCDSISLKLSEAVKAHCHSWADKYNISSERLTQIIFYHEVMWDLLDILESKHIISKPPILKGEEVGAEHFGDICYIVIKEDGK